MTPFIALTSGRTPLSLKSASVLVEHALFPCGKAMTEEAGVGLEEALRYKGVKVIGVDLSQVREGRVPAR
eukprot:750866-Hanusia_phi.AAC.2